MSKESIHELLFYYFYLPQKPLKTTLFKKLAENCVRIRRSRIGRNKKNKTSSSSFVNPTVSSMIDWSKTLAKLTGV